MLTKPNSSSFTDNMAKRDLYAAIQKQVDLLVATVREHQIEVCESLRTDRPHPRGHKDALEDYAYCVVEAHKTLRRLLADAYLLDET